MRPCDMRHAPCARSGPRSLPNGVCRMTHGVCRMPPVDMCLLPNKFRWLGALRGKCTRSPEQSSGGLRAGSYGLARWKRGLRSTAVGCSGRDTGCRRSRKATQDNRTSSERSHPSPSGERGRRTKARRAVGPRSCCSGERTRRWRMDTGPGWGRLVHPRFCWR